MRGLIVAIAILTAGCGEDPDTTCRPEGRADGESVVAGAPLGPFARAALISPDPRPLNIAWTLALDEGEGTCGEPGPGRRITALFCDTPAAQDYEVVIATAFRCPTEDVLVLLEDETGADLAEGVGGTIHIDYAGGCVTGTYDLQLGNDTIAGSFDAVVCPIE
jgi:hypothetical protein